MKAWTCLSKIYFLFPLNLLFFCAASQAAMYVYPMEASVGKNGASPIRVISQDDDVQFVKIKLKQIINPATKKEHELDNDISDDSQVIITPQKIALAAGGERVVRVVSMNLPPKETTWRAYFESVSENVFNSYPGEKKQQVNAAEVGVNIIWGVLVHVAPQKVVASLKYSASTGSVFNDGTIRISVKEIGVCRAGHECTWTKKGLTVYPEQEASVPGMNFSSANTYKIKYFNWVDNTTQEMALPAQQVN